MKVLMAAVALAVVVSAEVLAAGAPGQIAYQGFVTQNNVPVEGPHDLEFAVYADSTAGTAIWQEGHQAVPVTGGIFKVMLGKHQPLPADLFAAPNRFLETKIDTQVLLPRTRLAAVPYALVAVKADTAAFAQTGGSAESLWETNGTDVYRTSGNVGIGTTSPGELLHLEKGSGVGASMLVRSYVAGTGSFGKLQFQNVLATGAGIAAEIEAVRPVATWGQESDLLFKTNPGSPSPALSERMRITKDGNVGVGTPNPMDKLEVAGNATIGPYDGTLNDVVLRAAGGCPGCGGNSEGGSNLVLRSGIGTGSAASGDIIFQVSDNANFGNQQPHALLEAMRIQTTTSNVGIGTTNPTAKLEVAGDMCVTGAKNAIVPTSQGMTKLYCDESTEVWFSDRGRGRLGAGRARVDLDPLFRETVTIDDHHPMEVWITFYDPHGDYYVRSDHTGFEAIDPSGSDAAFSWKVEARRKGYEGVRLEPVAQADAGIAQEE